ncbi:MAG: GntR family transcriptional regulator [Candidatus Hydrogenedentota bacterium]
MITVDIQDPVPLEDQLCNGIRLAIAKGDIAPGDQLPSVRQLAADLGIHWNTVARAYRRMRDENLLVVGHGRRVSVRETAKARNVDPGTVRRVQAKVREAFAEGRIAGLTILQLEQLVQSELSDWSKSVT